MYYRSGRARPRLLSRAIKTAALATVLAGSTIAGATAAVFTAPQLNIYRDGTSADWLLGNSRLLADSFDNGNPLVGPNYAGSTQAASYTLLGLAPGADAALAAREVGGSLLLDPIYGDVSANAQGATARSLRLRLLTNITDDNAGLTRTRSFAATLRLSLSAMPQAGQSFGIRMADNFSNSNDYIELSVAGGASGDTVVLRKQDFVLGTVTVLGSAALAPTAGASMLVLSLSHSTPDSDQIFGSYNYADASGNLLNPSFTSLGSATAFHGETHTRVELRATSAVPEPASWLLMAGGGLLLAARRARLKS